MLGEISESIGNKHGEEITLRGNTLWGRDVLLMILMIIPLGSLLISSAGDRKNFAGDDLSVATC